MIEITPENFHTIDFDEGIIAYTDVRDKTWDNTGLIVLNTDRFCGEPRMYIRVPLDILFTQLITPHYYDKHKTYFTKASLFLHCQTCCYYWFSTFIDFAQWLRAREVMVPSGVDYRKICHDNTLTDEQCRRIDINLRTLAKLCEQQNAGLQVEEFQESTVNTQVDIDRNRAEIAYRLLERGILRALQNDTSDIDELKSNLRTCLDDTYNQYMKAMADNSSWWLL